MDSTKIVKPTIFQVRNAPRNEEIEVNVLCNPKKGPYGRKDPLKELPHVRGLSKSLLAIFGIG